jgi:hypothetical protein
MGLNEEKEVIHVAGNCLSDGYRRLVLGMRL